MIGKLKQFAVLALGVIVAVFGLIRVGRKQEQEAAAGRRAAEYVEAMERAKHADVSSGDSDADAAWLHERSKR